MMPTTTAVEEFERIIRHQSTPKLVPFLLQLAKEDIIAVRQKTKALDKELTDFRELKPSTWGSLITPEQRNMLFLAGLKTYSRKEAFGRDFTMWNQRTADLPAFWAVLESARPTWLSDWLLRWTDTNAWRLPGYEMLRKMEERQLIAYDAKLFAVCLPGLVHDLGVAMSTSGNIPPDAVAVIAERLQQDAQLLQRDLPALFDFDTPVSAIQANVQPVMPPGQKTKGTHTYPWQWWNQQYPPQMVAWQPLIVQLTATGHLDRADILTRCLLALRRDFRRPLLTWFKTLFLALQPSAEERLARQAELVELLAHPLPLVVNFALDQLKDLWALAGFEPAPLLLYAEGLMARQDLKTAIRSLLGTFEKMLKRTPALAPALARLATTALPNADAAVQERAAKLLAGVLGAKKPLLTAAETSEITATIGLYADLLAAAPRTVLAPFLAETTSHDAAAPISYTPLADFKPELSASTAIAPVRGWHELLFLTGEVLHYDDPAALERWLDGMLRLRPQFPVGYQEQLRPYLLQALPWALKGKTEAETVAILTDFKANEGYNGQRELLQALLVSWFLGFEKAKLSQVSLANHQYSNPDPLLQVEQRRLAAVETALRTLPQPLPLLSTPSHAPHWVVPTMLVQKLLAYEAAGQAPDSADLALALARTAFSAEAEAAEALAMLPQLQHEGLRDLLGWFLAPEASELAVPTPVSSEKSLVKSIANQLSRLLSAKRQAAPLPLAEALPWLWAVAARTRFPDATLDALRPLSAYPGVAEAWQPGWHFEQNSYTYKQTWNTERPEVTNVWQELRVPTDHQGQVPPSPLLLYSLHARLPQKNQHYQWSLGNDLAFLLTMVPNNPSPLHWHVLRTACRTNSSGSEGREIMQKLLQSLLAPGPRFDESASVLLAVGLTHFAPVCRALALEVALAAIEAGRLVPALLGQALGRILAAEFAPVQRLVEGLGQARAINPATDDALRQTMETLLPALPAAPLRNTRKLIEAYADLMGRIGQAVPTDVQARLRDWQPTASLKKAASALLV